MTLVLNGDEAEVGDQKNKKIMASLNLLPILNSRIDQNIQMYGVEVRLHYWVFWKNLHISQLLSPYLSLLLWGSMVLETSLSWSTSSVKSAELKNSQ